MSGRKFSQVEGADRSIDRVSLIESIDGFRIDLSDLIERSNGHSRIKLVRLIEERQERLILQLCGPRYSRGHPYRRGGSYWKTLVTSIGTIKFRVKKVIRREDGRVFSPILEALDIKRRKYSRDVRMKLAEFASVMSYRDASREFETATGVHVPKRTIHSLVKEIAPTLLEANRTTDDPRIVMGDSTKIRGLGSGDMK